MEHPHQAAVRALIASLAATKPPPSDAGQALVRLRELGAQPYDAILTIEQLFGLSFNDSKDALSLSPAWADIVRASIPAQQSAEEAANLLDQE